MPKISGGYYLKARCIQESEIAHAPPHVREIWDWLIKEANHKDKKINGKTIKRGQCVRSYKDIQEGLSWKVGYRKMKYSKTQIQVAMRYLTRATMITTTKTTRGMIITILNYDKFQNPENYEIHNKSTTSPQSVHTINKNVKNERNNKNEFYFKNPIQLPSDIYLTDQMINYAKKEGCDDKNHIQYMFKKFCNYWGGKNKRRNDWTKTFYNWVLEDKKKYNSDKYVKRVPL